MATEEDDSGHLFLMECHVSEVHFHSPETLDEPNTDTRQKVCITISFLHFAELLLCDETSEERMKGKSFLFALPKYALNRFATSAIDPNIFLLSLRVYRADLNGVGHTHSILGEASIPLGEKFSNMSRMVIFESIMPPTTFSIDMKCKLKNETEVEIGTLQTSLRMSCFGKMIVTHIHMAPSDAERELPKDLMRKITALTERHISAIPTAKERKETKNAAGLNIVATSTLDKSTPYVEFQKTIEIRRKNLDTNWKDWNDLLGHPPIDFVKPLETKAVRNPPHSTPSYEEITAKVNGNMLFFKVLKDVKREKIWESADSKQNGPSIDLITPASPSRYSDQEVGNFDNEARITKSNSKIKEWETDISNEVNERGINARGKILSPNCDAKVGFNKDVAIAASKTSALECLLEKDAQITSVENEVVEPGFFSATKEVFSLKVGKKNNIAGILQPKVILKILAPKTKEDLEQEHEFAELEEKKIKRLQTKHKLRELISKETQFCEADFEEQDAPDQAQKQARKRAKPKRGKKI